MLAVLKSFSVPLQAARTAGWTSSCHQTPYVCLPWIANEHLIGPNSTLCKRFCLYIMIPRMARVEQEGIRNSCSSLFHSPQVFLWLWLSILVSLEELFCEFCKVKSHIANVPWTVQTQVVLLRLGWCLFFFQCSAHLGSKTLSSWTKKQQKLVFLRDFHPDVHPIESVKTDLIPNLFGSQGLPLPGRKSWRIAPFFPGAFVRKALGRTSLEGSRKMVGEFRPTVFPWFCEFLVIFIFIFGHSF